MKPWAPGTGLAHGFFFGTEAGRPSLAGKAFRVFRAGTAEFSCARKMTFVGLCPKPRSFTFSFAVSRLCRFFGVFRGFPSVTHGYNPTPLRG
jgi:hypothetical protein